MQEAVVTVVDQELLECLETAAYYSLMFDESTDISTNQTLIINVWFVCNCVGTTRFLQIIELPD